MTQAHRLPEEATPERPTASAQTSKRSGTRESRQRPMFDTLQVARDLKKGGFSEPQAEAVVSAFNSISQNMVTKAELKTELTALETRLIVRMYMTASLAAGFVVGVITLVIKL